MILKSKLTAYTRLVLIGALSLQSLYFIACHDEPEPPATRPEISEDAQGIVTSFTLRSEHFDIAEDVKAVRIALISKSGFTECFNANVQRENGLIRFNMLIPESVSLPEGEYILTMRRADGHSIPGRLSARFQEGMLRDVSIIWPSYMLDGSGTEDDPYLIKNDDDFSMFLINLSDDTESYGAGLKFVQTGDVTAPDQSSLITGRGYWGAPFAGIFDGGGHSIRNLYYHGASREDSDSGIGLFLSLLGSASVSNLSLTGISMSGLYRESAPIAGYTSGDVSLANVSVAGFIRDGEAIGGMVGYVGSGSLTITDASLHISVEGSNDVGGLIGRIDPGASVLVEGLTTPDYHFSISGMENTGGVVGRSQGSLSVTDARLEHKVSGEDSDINIIESSGEGIGGIVGTITASAGDHSFTGCHILCPVGGKDAASVGGIVGQTSQSSKLTLKDCRMYSVVRGGRATGGIIGKADFSESSTGLTVDGSDFQTRVAADDAEARVEGGEFTGGFAGSWKGTLNFNAKIRINIPVSGDRFTGGVFGYISDTSVDMTRVVFNSGTSNDAPTTMRVTGNVSTGGFMGKAERCVIKGDSKFDFSEYGHDIRVPESTQFIPQFQGVVIGDENVGGLIGEASACVTQYLCSSASVTGKRNVGGLVGYFYDPKDQTLVEDCIFKGSLNVGEAQCVGGVIGFYRTGAKGMIKDCVNYASVSGGDYTGGVVGYIQKDYAGWVDAEARSMKVRWCVNMGSVSGTNRVGGVVGWMDAPNVEQSYGTMDTLIEYSMNAGAVSGGPGSSAGAIGGVIGKTGKNSGVLYCANHGAVTGNGKCQGIGGVIGIAGHDVSGAGVFDGYLNVNVNECVNTATVTSSNGDSYVGGVVGYLEERHSNINDCHNLGEIPCKLNHDAGGIVGCVDHLSNIYRCVNQGMVSHGNAVIGTHKSGSLFNHDYLYYLDGTGKGWPSAKSVSKANFTKQSSFGGLDFLGIWYMDVDGPALGRCSWRDPRKADYKE